MRLALPALVSDESFSLEDTFPVLASFLPEAESSWQDGSTETAYSGFWTELRDGHQPIHLEAWTLSVGPRRLIVVVRNERLFSHEEMVLQRARELRMTHQTLLREIEHKDILVHSIVHDLASPLHSILGALSLLRELPLDEQGARWVQIALDAAMRQRELVSEILRAFAAEYGTAVTLPDASAGPDLASAIDEVIHEALPTAQSRGLVLRADVGAGPWRVVADRTRLVRVLANLVDNALRHCPAGGTVMVSAERDEGGVRVNVDDEGPGVAPEIVPHLFERFGGQLGKVAGTGLGLYFCRITVEQWGGGIGYERWNGGSRFWIRLVDALTRRRYG